MKILPQTRQEISNAYRISHRTFDRWLKRAGIQLTPGLITPKELQLIYDTFGPPDKDQQVVSEPQAIPNPGR